MIDLNFFFYFILFSDLGLGISVMLYINVTHWSHETWNIVEGLRTR